jgi:hypothetical protein
MTGSGLLLKEKHAGIPGVLFVVVSIAVIHFDLRVSMRSAPLSIIVIPAQAGIHGSMGVKSAIRRWCGNALAWEANASVLWLAWIPACAGMTD